VVGERLPVAVGGAGEQVAAGLVEVARLKHAQRGARDGVVDAAGAATVLGTTSPLPGWARQVEAFPLLNQRPSLDAEATVT